MQLGRGSYCTSSSFAGTTSPYAKPTSATNAATSATIAYIVRLCAFPTRQLWSDASNLLAASQAAVVTNDRTGLVCALPTLVVHPLEWIFLSLASSTRDKRKPPEVTPDTVTGLCKSLVGHVRSLPHRCECHGLDNGRCLQDA